MVTADRRPQNSNWDPPKTKQERYPLERIHIQLESRPCPFKRIHKNACKKERMYSTTQYTKFQTVFF
jgi:hypothetical protein